MSENTLQESTYSPGEQILRQEEDPASLALLLEGEVRISLTGEGGEYSGEAALVSRRGEVLDASSVCGLLTAPLSLHAGESGARVMFLPGPEALFSSASSAAGELLSTDKTESHDTQILLREFTPARLINSVAQAFWRQVHLLRQQTVIQVKLDRAFRHFLTESENLLHVLERRERNAHLAGLSAAGEASGASLHQLLPPSPAIDLERLLSRHPEAQLSRQDGRRFVFSDGQVLAWNKNLPCGIYALVRGEVETVISGIVIDRSGKDSFCGLFNSWPGKGREMFGDDIFSRACGETELQYVCSSWDELHALICHSARLQRAMLSLVAERYENLLYLSALLGRKILSDCDLLDGAEHSCAAFFAAVEAQGGGGQTVATSRVESIRNIAGQIRRELQTLHTEY